ncbi:MAG TPA: glycosyltransferase family 39 protein [Anaerolineae bacterium]|nr:glycosyltransferase family 39 protein [Anaerolineae bacterium]
MLWISGLVHRGAESARQRWHFILLACLVVFHVINSWSWISTNVVVLNSDTRRHLMTALTYHDVLNPLSLRSLFDMIILDEYRPPLFQLSAVPLLWLFGRSTDVATMVNAIYMAVLLGSTYAVGRKVFDRNVGLLAAFVLSTFPMIYAMSRYFFLDFALTAMVALNIALLLYTENFERKGYSLLYGLTFGLGMLVKWTFVVFAVPAALLVLLRSPLARSAVRKLGSLRVDMQWAVTSVLISLAATLLWYLPNLERARQLFLGSWLLPIMWFTLALTIYALSRPSDPATNLFGAIMAGFSMASIWYLPRIAFIREFFLVAYGKPKGTFWGFGRYLHYLVEEQLSAFYVAVLFLVLIVLGYRSRKWIRTFAARDWLTGNYALIGLWAVLPYFVFSIRTSTIHSRYVMPLLPALALVISQGLLSVPWRKTRLTLLITVVAVALVQFFSLSYDRMEPLRTLAIIDLAGGRQLDLFAHGELNQLPNSGVTDSRYWVMPDILQFMREDSLRNGRSEAELGILVKTPYVQPSTFELVSMERGYPELTMRELARAWSDAPVYPQLFELDYLVLKDGSKEGTNRQETIELVDSILRGDSPFLSEVFQVARRYPLPDGETVYLYRKKYHLMGYNEEDYRALAQDIASLGPGDDAIIFERPEQIEVFARHYQGTAVPYALPRQVTLDRNATVAEMERIAAKHDLIFAVLWQDEQVDPSHSVEDWLNRRTYRAMTSWYGPARLIVYAARLHPEGRVHFYTSRARFGLDIGLTGYILHTTEAAPGRMLRVTLDWSADQAPQKDYKVFLHLLDGEDRIVAQHDSAPVGGSEPTSSWGAGKSIADNHGVLVPWGTPPSEYRLVLGMYDASTGRRLPVSIEGRLLEGDRLVLGQIRVLP